MDTFYQLDVRMDKDEYRNFITIFIDEYNLFLKTDDYYSQFHKTYISLFNADIYDILHARENSEIVLSFRIPGATRGGIVLTKGHTENTDDTTTIHCKIKSIEFIESTCFTTFKAYDRQVVEKSNDKFRDKELIINIYNKGDTNND